LHKGTNAKRCERKTLEFSFHPGATITRNCCLLCKRRRLKRAYRSQTKHQEKGQLLIENKRNFAVKEKVEIKTTLYVGAPEEAIQQYLFLIKRKQKNSFSMLPLYCFEHTKITKASYFKHSIILKLP
jgi:hypothetical protein